MSLLRVAPLIAAAGLAFAAQAEPAADADRRALAHRIIAASGGAEAAETQVRQIYSSIADVTKGIEPYSDPKVKAISDSVFNYMLEEQIKAIPEMMQQSVDIYAANFTEQELRDLLAYTESPSGQSIQAKMPVVMQQIVVAQTPLMRKIMKGATTVAIDRACADAKCTDEERRIITSLAQKALPSS